MSEENIKNENLEEEKNQNEKTEKKEEKKNRVVEFILSEHKLENYLLL